MICTLSGSLGNSSPCSCCNQLPCLILVTVKQRCSSEHRHFPCDDLQPKWDLNTSLVFSTGQQGRSSHDLEWARRELGKAVCVLPHTAPLVLGPPTAFLPASICVFSDAAPQESPLPLQSQTSGAMLMPGKGFFCRH